PAFVVDREWRVILSNDSAARIVAACLDTTALQSSSPDGTLNFMRMMFEPTQMRPRIRNWQMVGPRLLARLRREAQGDPRSPSAVLLKQLGPSANCSLPDDQDRAELPTVPLELCMRGTTLRLFNSITTFGTPQDVGLQELRIEMSYPMDVATRDFLAAGADNKKAG